MKGKAVGMTDILIIDCFKLVKGAGKSIGIYNLALNLVRRLGHRNITEQKRIIVFGNRYNRKDFEVEGVEFVEIERNPHNKLYLVWWELFAVSNMASKYKADLILFPRGYASILHRTRECIIIHDMIPFYYHEHFKDYFNKLENAYILWRLKASARSADGVITISEASKADILKYAKVSPDKITIINNGYNPIPPMDFGEPSRDYLVAITSKLPHKNALGIVKSYECYCKRVEEPLPIKIIGLAKENLDALGCDLSDKARKGIECIGYIDSNEVLYKTIHDAKVFVFLSLIEGFGFPPIEAMSLGTPVICSGISSLPEVAGEGAYYVDPTDYEGVADMIVKVTSSCEDCQEMIEKGLSNIERFSWDKVEEKYWNRLFDL